MNNESAFPTGIITDDKGIIIGGSNGMSLRDYFAAKAMPLALEILRADYMRDDPNYCWDYSCDADLLAKFSYDLANAMLVARQEESQA